MSKYASAQWFPDLFGPIPPPLVELGKALIWEFAPEAIEAGAAAARKVYKHFKEKPFTTGAQAVYGAEADRVTPPVTPFVDYIPDVVTWDIQRQARIEETFRAPIVDDYVPEVVRWDIQRQARLETASTATESATTQGTFTPHPVPDSGVRNGMSKEAPIMRGNECMPFWGLDYDTPMFPPDNIVAYSWVTNPHAPEDEQIRFFRLINGKIAVRRKNGVWKMWTPKKMIVLSNNPRLGQFNRASKKIITLSKKLDKNFKALNPPRRRAK